MELSEVLSARDHHRLAEFIAQQVGIQLPSHKRPLIESRLRKRLRATHQTTFRNYLDWALVDQHEQVLLIDVLTTNKTNFYREASHFEFLIQALHQSLADSGGKKKYRFWSAGCSTGEEAYTLAMELEQLKDHYPGFSYTIEATDIAVSVLNTAKRGIYSHDLIAPVPIELRKRFLLRKKTAQEDLVKIDVLLKQYIRFRTFNLMSGDYSAMGYFDGIFCRNVMIYFDGPTREQMILNFVRALESTGLFFIGHSEGLSAQQYGLVSPAPTVYQKAPLGEKK